MPHWVRFRRRASEFRPILYTARIRPCPQFGIKPILFFPSAKCSVPEGNETPEQRELQKKYVEQLRSTSELIRYEFDDKMHLRSLIAEAVSAVSPEAAGGKIAQTARRDFPTPLSVSYDNRIPKEDTLSVWSFVNDLLRFAGLLAIHDSVVHRIFGSQNVDRKTLSRKLAQPETPRDWRSLLFLACPDEGSHNGNRFITEFNGWQRRNSQAIDKIVNYSQALQSSGNVDPLELIATMNSIIDNLEFFKRYVLVAITQVNNGGKCTVIILRGLAARSFEFTIDPQSPFEIQKNQLYLLDLDRSRALLLNPAFKYVAAAGQERVYLWGGLDPDVNVNTNGDADSVTTLMTGDAERMPISERRDTLSAWLGEELCEDAFGFRTKPKSISWRGRLFTHDSWNKIREVVSPMGTEPSVVGERFRLERTPLHRGLYSDVFEATDIASDHDGENKSGEPQVPKRPLLHVLRAEAAADEQILEWFTHRAECWKQTRHPGVLRLYELSDPTGDEGLPFLLTDSVPGSRSLANLLQGGDPVADVTVRQAIRLAAEACRAAHQQGIFLFALPPRHFLIGPGDTLFLTGFEAAMMAKPHSEFPPSLVRRLARFSRDLDIIAPEVRRDFGTFAPTLDVFAIGRLITQLRRMPTQVMDVLPISNWNDPWCCIAYHCLAADPHVRFQSTGQILTFLEEWPSSNEPMTVAVEATTTEPAFLIGKYPVTNAQYRRFCAERYFPLPAYLWDRVHQDDEQQALLSRRLSGPWLPVTCISLDDAEKYCDWLSDRTKKTWRLPTEAEWMRAAGDGINGPYPWGEAVPDRSLSNWGRYYRGPTVVGAFSGGRSHANCWDMAGNVWEWCTDILKNGAPRRVLKGGAYDYSAESLQVSRRDAKVVTCRSPHIGFRVLCEENR